MAGETLTLDPETRPPAREGQLSTEGWVREHATAAAAFAPLAAAAVALWFIVPTVMPGVANWDTAEFQTVGPVLGTAHPTGFPSYVVLGWIASNLIPLGDPAYRMNLLQAILAAVAIAGTVGIVQELTGMRWIALATGLLLGTTQLFWRLSTHADPHMFHVALLASLFFLLVGWERRRRSGDGALASRAHRWLVAAAFVYGVAVANHSLALLLAPPIGVYVLIVEPRILLRPRMLVACAGVLAITVVAFFLELPIRALMHAPLVYGHPETWAGFQYIVLAEQFRGSLGDPLADLPTKFQHVIDLLTGWLGPLTYPAAIGLGSSLVRRPRFAILSLLSVVLTCGFAASYANADIERYYLGPLLIAFTWAGLAIADFLGLAVWIASGFDRADSSDGPGAPNRLAGLAGLLGGRPGSLRAGLAGWAVGEAAAPPRWVAGGPEPAANPPDLATGTSEDAEGGAHAPDGGRRRGEMLVVLQPLVAVLLLVPVLAIVPERQHVPSAAHPGGVSEATRTGDGTWLKAVFASPDQGGLPADSVMVTWWSASTTLWYGQRVEGLRQDITIVDDRTMLDQNLGTAPDVIDRALAQGHRVFVIRVNGNGTGDIDTLRRLYDIEPFRLPNGQGTINEVIRRLENTQ